VLKAGRRVVIGGLSILRGIGGTRLLVKAMSTDGALSRRGTGPAPRAYRRTRSPVLSTLPPASGVGIRCDVVLGRLCM
jgi:hypothetical protein